MGLRSLSEETFDQFLLRHLQVLSNVAEDSLHRSELDRIVIWDGDEVLGSCVGASQADVTARLSNAHISENAQGANQVGATEIARHLHAEMTRSRTRCSRMTAGTSPSSKWQRTASRTAPSNSGRDSASVKVEAGRARGSEAPPRL